MKNETLSYLLQKYLEGTLSEPESASLTAFINDDANKDRVTEELTRLSLQHPASGDFDEARFMPLLTAIFNADKPLIQQPAKLYPVPAQKSAIRKRVIYWAAASVLFVTGTFLYFQYEVQRKRANNKVASGPVNDIRPGGNKAILTLANGSKIILDSTLNGAIAAQGNIRISKLKEGELLYRPTAEATEAVVYNTLTTPRGGQYQVTLSDGTQIWLNAASSITYPTVFTGDQRNVTITGEVYFKVATDKSRPFRVKAGDRMTVDVLGTEFNINAYEDGHTITTTLLQGAVKVGNSQSQQVLSPGQQAQAANEEGGKIRVIDEADLEQAVAWKNGMFYFKRDDIEAVMKQIERWYDVQVLFNKKSRFHFTGKVPRQSNVSQVLKTIALTEAVQFTIDGKTIKVE